MKTVLLFIGTLLVYAALDLTFITLLAKGFIQRQIPQLLAPKPDLIAAGVFYLIFIAGILYFCVYPADKPAKALLNGAFFGLVTYATYELVNKSLLDKWPLALVVVDLAWGVFVGAAVSWVSFLLKKWLDL